MTHRGEAMHALWAGMQEPLKQVFRTSRPVLIGAGSGTSFMEAAIRSGVRERVLCVVGGEYGRRFAEIAVACDKEVIQVMVPHGRALEADHLEQFLDGPEVDAVALVHAETSTGALAPLADLAAVVRAHKDVLLLVDAVSAVGGLPVETDLWGLDFVFSAGQKALAVPPGLALGVASPRLLERARGIEARGRYLDLARLAEAAERQEPPTTPALPQMYALDAQLRRIREAGGIEPRWKRHHEMLTAVEEWSLLHPAVELLAQAGRRAWTVSCLRLPPARPADRVIQGLAARGFTVGQGMGAMQESVIRIGHMGEVTPDHVQGLLQALAEELAGEAP